MKKLIVTLFFLQAGISSFSQLVIQMKREGGVSVVPCKINGLSLSFIFDTGASDVTISLTEASFMLKNGYLKNEDIIGSEKYLDATGNISEGITINIREIEIGGLKLKNVKASIVKTLGAPLLLGQSALNKLGIIYLDLDKNQLTIVSASKNIKTEPKKSNDALKNSRAYRNGLIHLSKYITATSVDNTSLSKYFTLDTLGNLNYTSLWAAPSDTYKALNASSYYYTFSDDRTNKRIITGTNSNETSLLQTFNNLKLFSQDNGIDWNLLDTTDIIIKPYSDNEICFSFNCGSKSYFFVTAITEVFTDKTQAVKVNLPKRIDSKSFFEFRNAVYNKFLSEIDNIEQSKDQNIELSYFYEDLINNFETTYNKLSSTDKEKFSSIYFEPSYWCERAANLKGAFLGNDEETLLRKLSLFTKGISLYEINVYPFMKKSYNYTFLYSYRGACKYKMKDYEGAYRDYKKAIEIYEKNLAARDALKTSITEFYYDFSNVCYFLKRYSECNLSIQKGIVTYSTELDKYLANVTLYRLYSLKGYLNYFIYKNKQQACKAWSRAGELGDKDAFDFMKKYCSK